MRTRNWDILNFLISQVTVPDGSGCHRRRGDPPRIGQDGKRKLTESAGGFPKSFRLTESVRVAPRPTEYSSRYSVRQREPHAKPRRVEHFHDWDFWSTWRATASRSS